MAQGDTVKGPVPIPMTSSAMAGMSPMPMPGTTGPLKANPRPIGYKTGLLGTMYITGVASGIAQWQNSVYSGDRETQTDVSNAQIFFQKTEGIIQYFLQLGGYSVPDIGAPYFRSSRATKDFFGLFPQGYLKIVPANNFSIQAGKLPTLVGAEYTFSYENFNIQRGLLWNQENAVTRGVQANFVVGPLTLSVSCDDGFYSDKYTWAWLSATYAIDSSNTLAFVGGGNTKHEDVSSLATPLYQNNQQIYGLTYVHTKNKWTIEPYLQYTYVPRIFEIGASKKGETYGAAVYVNYAALTNDNGNNINLPLRLEFINSTGDASSGAPNLLYGAGSKAWSLTITPTYQYKRFFVRPEFSFVKATGITSGLALGQSGSNNAQTRLLVELGVLF